MAIPLPASARLPDYCCVSGDGVREGNPLVRLVLGVGINPIWSLLVVKFLAILLGLYCWRVGKRQLLWRINLLFALLIAWNLIALILSSVQT